MKLSAQWRVGVLAVGTALITLILLAYSVAYMNESYAQCPIGNEGVLVLSTPVDVTGPVPLTDGWAFYPGQLLTPAQAADAKNPMYVRVDKRGGWNGYEKDGHPLGGAGWGTYRLNVRTHAADTYFALECSAIYSAARVYMNGVLVFESGMPSPDRALAAEQLIPLRASFCVTGEEFTIVIQAYNQTGAYGGLYYPPLLGTTAQMEARHMRDILRDAISVTALLFMAGCAALVYVRQTNRRELPAFVLFCLSMAVYMAAHGKLFLLPAARVFGSFLLNFTWLCVLCLALAYFRACCLPAMDGEQNRFFRALFSRKLLLGIFALLALYGLFIGLMPKAQPPDHVTVYLFGELALLMGYALLILWRCALRDPRRITLPFLGCVIFTISCVYELLNPVRCLPNWQAYAFFGALCMGALLLWQFSSGYGSAVRDVTQLTLTDETRLRALCEIAHDLRAPLASVRGYAELLQPGLQENPQQARMMEKLLERLCELDRITGELAELSRLRGASIPFVYADTDLGAFLDEVYAFYADEAQRRCRTLSRKHNLHGVHVQADMNRLWHVMSNLVSNAFAYTKDGGVIAIDGYLLKKNAVVIVHDDGVGMSAAMAERAFEQFYRAEKQPDGLKGLGLGLYIVKNIVEAHGGRVWMDTREGGGCAVHFTLPCSFVSPQGESLSSVPFL